MTETKSMDSQSQDSVQKSKLSVLLIILEIIGILIAIPCALTNIKSVGNAITEFLNLGDNALTLHMILIGIVLAIIIVSAILNSYLRKRNMISKRTQNVYMTLNIIICILVIVNLVLGLF